MVSGRRFGKRYFGLAWVVVLLAGLLGSVAPATGVDVSPGTLGGFEQDGNFVPNTPGNLDWTNVTPTKVIDDNLDSGFEGSSKEEQPTKWICNTGGNDPKKGNILRAYVDPRIGSSAGTNFAYLDLGFVREAGDGDAHVNFEFNKEPSANPPTAAGPCPINRSIGDFLVTYDFPGGNSAAEIRAWRWDGTHWVELTLQPSDAAAATNADPLTDPLDANSDVVARGFGEVTLNLLAAGLPADLVGCPGLGTVNVRSRSSESIDSALQDKLPSTAVSLSDCGKLVIHKTDNHQPPQALAGAVFGLYANSTATGTPVQTCTSLADGTCPFDQVTPGDYWIKEITAPDGYTPDPAIRPVTVHFLETVNLTAEPFVDPRDTGFVHIVKELRDDKGNVVTAPDSHLLDGASFVIYRDANGDGVFQPGETAKLWPADTSPATCTITGGTGACDTGPIATGAYRVHETVAPSGTTRGPDVNVTVTTGTAASPVTVTYANILSPLNLHLVKGGPTYAHVGDTFTYTFSATTTGPRLHDISLAELSPDRCSTPLVGPTGDTNTNGFLEPGETWQWTCNHTVTAGDPDPLPNTATVTGTDDFNRTVTATASHSVDVVHAGITVVKTGPATAHEGDTVTYSFAVTNSGDTTLTNVVVTDDKLGSIGTIPTLAAGATVTLTKDYTIPAGSTAVDNTATACGADPLAAQVCDTDHHHLTPLHPAIVVAKTGPASAHVGDTITYGFSVTNPGDVDLHNVGITDARCDATPTATGGDTNHDGVLQTTETWTYTCQHLITAGDPDPLPNTVTATGTDTLGSTVTATASHSVDLIHPGITVVKTGPATAHEGDVVTYSFAVTNSGDTALTNVVVTDDKLGSIGTIPTLAAGATVTLTKDYTIPAGSTAVDNTATACGVDPLGERGCDTDSHHLTPIHPAIAVAKTGPATAAPGDVITYTFKVTNIGDVDLTNLTVTDDKLGDVGSLPSLAVGESKTLTKTFTVPAGVASVDNTANACGSDPLTLEVCGTAAHHLSVVQVLGEMFARPLAPQASGVLAVTGENTGLRSVVGLGLLLGGFGLVLLRRRRQAG